MGLVAKPGYWRWGVGSPFFNQCPNSDACLGGSAYMTPRTDWGNATAAVIEGLRKERIESQKEMGLPGAANGDSVCLQGYASIKCAVCAEGYGKTGDDCVDCTPAHQSALDWFMVGALPAWTIFQMVGLVAASMSEDGLEDGLSTMLKILTNYMQLASIAGNLDIQYPAFVDSISTWMESLSQAGSYLDSVAAFDCVVKPTYYQTTTFSFVTPLLSIIVPLLYCTLVKAFLRNKQREIGGLTPDQEHHYHDLSVVLVTPPI